MELYDLLKYLINAFEKLGIHYFITVSIGSIFYVEQRFTNDIDVVVDIDERDVPGLVSSFPEGEFYINEDSIHDAIKHKRQFNIIHPSSGLKIDVIVSKKDDFDNSRFARKHRISPIENTEANLSSPEDVIIMKMKFYKEGESEKHIRDITGMLKVSGDIIDRKYIEDWANKLALQDIWEAIINKL